MGKMTFSLVKKKAKQATLNEYEIEFVQENKQSD